MEIFTELCMAQLLGHKIICVMLLDTKLKKPLPKGWRGKESEFQDEMIFESNNFSQKTKIRLKLLGTEMTMSQGEKFAGKRVLRGYRIETQITEEGQHLNCLQEETD